VAACREGYPLAKVTGGSGESETAPLPGTGSRNGLNAVALVKDPQRGLQRYPAECRGSKVT